MKWPKRYWSAFTAGIVGLVLLAWLTLVRQPGPVEDVANQAQPSDSVAVATQDIDEHRIPVVDRSAAEASSSDLHGASPSFRNSTLVSAIRRAGFYCADVVSAHESSDGVWVASCSDMLGYVVTLRGTEFLDVHPVAQYFDGLAPDRERLIERQPLK